jgi:hypothetical protein
MNALKLVFSLASGTEALRKIRLHSPTYPPYWRVPKLNS